MPGAQDRWGQLTEPSAPRREATAGDRPQLVDRPERGSLAEMQQRLERLPPGHPSSPYNDDLTRKPPVARLKDLELPLQGNEHGANGTGTHYEPDPAEEVPATARTEPARAEPARTEPARTEPARTEPASSNGTSGRSPAADGLSVTSWASTGEWTSSAPDPGTANELDGFTDARDHIADVPDRRVDSYEPDRHEPDGDELDGTPNGWDSTANAWDSTPNGRDSTANAWDSTPNGRDSTANGHDSTANGHDGAPDWLSTPAWGATTDLGGGNSQASATASGDVAADWEGTAGWDNTGDWERPPDRDTADRDTAYQDEEAGPGWTEPESAADTLSHAVIDTGLHREAAAPVTGADGSWQWNGRYLTPDECHVAEEALGRCRIAEGRNVFGGYGHSGLTPAMRRVEAQLEHGSLAPETENFTLKSADSFKKKLADLILRHPDKSAEELALEVPDGIRYAFIVEAEYYTEATLQAHSRLKGNGFDLEVRRNCWKSPGYKGINSRWRDPAHDLVFEVQFHTVPSWDARQRAQALYEAIRDLGTPPEQRARLRDIYAEMSASISVPPGCTAIPDYRKEGR
jgi:hypothetical protein